MKILSHRGYWECGEEKNTLEAMKKSLQEGFGFESDVRDYQGKLVISHNIADDTCQNADYVFEMLRKYEDKFCFAINIKADGLIEALKKELEKNDIKNYFTFDMSVPQMIEYKEAGIRFFTRQSEYEMNPVMYQDAAGVWIDGFYDMTWITEKLLQNHIASGKYVCIVSPELHQREYRSFWLDLKNMKLDFQKVILCTDYPGEAKSFFELEEEA